MSSFKIKPLKALATTKTPPPPQTKTMLKFGWIMPDLGQKSLIRVGRGEGP